MSSERKNNIPFCAPGKRFHRFGQAIAQATARVLNSGHYILGDEVTHFEEEFAQYIGVRHCVAVNSCTDAITLSLMAHGVRKGDEVISTAFTAPATVVGIINAGATPVLVDVAAPTYTIDPDQIEQAVTERTKAIIPVHLHGYAADMVAINVIAEKHAVPVIEDGAQAHGAVCAGKKIGAIGACGVFSFYPTKNLGGMGDGGAITTNDDALAGELRALRNYGMAEGKINMPGLNSRLSEVQAAVLRLLLPHLNHYNQERWLWASRYHDALHEYNDLLPPLIKGAVYHQFPLLVNDRDAFRHKLAKYGLTTGIHYPYTMQDHPAFRPYCHSLPIALQAANQMVSLPIQPEILQDHFEEIIDLLQHMLSQHPGD